MEYLRGKTKQCTVKEAVGMESQLYLQSVSSSTLKYIACLSHVLDASKMMYHSVDRP